MINAILNGILNMITSVVGIILTPLNNLITSLFPDFSGAITNFTNMINTYLGGGLAYASSFIPPLTKSMLLLWFTFLLTYYGVIFSYSVITKVWDIIQKVKFW